MALSSAIRSKINLFASRSEVMDKLLDLTLMSKWCSSIERCEKISTKEINIGSRYKVESAFLGRTLFHEVEITKYVPVTICSVESYSGPIPFQLNFSLEEIEIGTLLLIEYQLDFSSLGSFVEKIASDMATAQIEKDLLNLKNLVESSR